MFDAQLVLAELVAPNPDTVLYSPWFSREGDHAFFCLEIVALSEAVVQVEVFTKAAEDPGDGTAVSGSLSASSVGKTEAEFGGLEQLVWFKYTVSVDAASLESSAWALFRMLPPVWFDAVAA